MDKFKWKIFIEVLENSPTELSLDLFEESLLALPTEDLNSVAEALKCTTSTPSDVKTAKHVIEMLQILWHYQ